MNSLTESNHFCVDLKMSETIAMPTDARVLVDAHLDDVDAVLRQSGIPREERRTICDELECQIVATLSERCDGIPNASDAKAILAEMDAPESFAEPTKQSRTSPMPAEEPAVSLLAVAAATIAISGIVFAFIYAEWRGAESDRQQAAIIVFLITFLAMVMGATAIREMRLRRGAMRGYMLAFIAVVSLPICFCLWGSREIAYPVNTQLGREVAAYRASQRTIVRTSDGDIVHIFGKDLPAEATIISPADPEPVDRPFIPWISTGQGVYLFSLATCFGPTMVLTAIFAPLFYRRYNPVRK